MFSKNIKVGAFIQSLNRKRSPLKCGFPTLEDYRDKDVRSCANHLMALGNSSVFIGDSLPDENELKELSSLKKDAIELRVKLLVNDDFYKKLLSNFYSSRLDDSRDCIRTNESRKFIESKPIYPINNIDAKKGYITIDNIDYGRYMGDLQILKKDIEADNRLNVIASILQEDMYLLEYINSGRKFYFNVID